MWFSMELTNVLVHFIQLLYFSLIEDKKLRSTAIKMCVIYYVSCVIIICLQRHLLEKRRSK